MRLTATGLPNRGLVLLAPSGVEPTCFASVMGNRHIYNTALREIQRFRGKVAVSEGNLSSTDLSPDGRHVQGADPKSWHLLTLNEQGSVGACARILVHRSHATFHDLLVSHCALACCEGWGFLLRRAIEEKMELTQRWGMQFAEIGGWVVDRSLRCTTEAVRLVMAGYALGRLLGGVIGISTADARSHSSSILRRIGGAPLMAGEIPFPKFYEPKYRTEIEILCLDSFRLNPQFEQQQQECITALETATVISSVPSLKPIRQNFGSDLCMRTFTGTSIGLEGQQFRHV